MTQLGLQGGYSTTTLDAPGAVSFRTFAFGYELRRLLAVQQSCTTR